MGLGCHSPVVVISERADSVAGGGIMAKASTEVRIERDAVVMGPVRVTFQRTLRIPEEGLHPLPPGLGAFPLRRVQDYPDTAPTSWLERGGVMLPVYRSACPQPPCGSLHGHRAAIHEQVSPDADGSKQRNPLQQRLSAPLRGVS